MASPNISEIATTTIEARSKKLADNVTNNVALLNYINKRGNVATFDGGRVIYEELAYQQNSTYKRYTGAEVLDITPSDTFTAAEFSIKQAAVAVVINGLEELQNAGEEQMINLLEARIQNAEDTFMNNLCADAYSDGTADSGKQVGGLQLLVSATPTTGTVGGINRATWTFWQNSRYRSVTDGGAAASAANIQRYMNLLTLRCTRNADRPNVYIADNNFFSFYLESLQGIQRVTNDTSADAGFQTLKYMGADVVFDGGYGGSAPANQMYALNTKYIKWRPHANRNMKPLNPDRFSTNQDAMVKLIGWAGNMTLRCAFLQGILTNT